MKPDDFIAASSQAQDRSYWQTLAPTASIEQPVPTTISRPATEHLLDTMRHQGYLHISNVLDQDAMAQTLQVAHTVEAAGWLPTFAFVYDAPWLLARHAGVQQVVSSVLGPGYRQLPDFWAYHVHAGERGYRPHREVLRDDTVEPDGTPRSMTVWLPLTDATLDNGCMYVVPRHLESHELDPAEYGTDPSAVIPYLLHRAQALPAPAGSLLSWNHMILHWGSFSSPCAAHSRRSMSFEFVRTDRPGYVHPHSILPQDLPRHAPVTLSPNDPLPSFQTRLFFIARNIRNYYGRHPDDPYQQMATAWMHQFLQTV